MDINEYIKSFGWTAEELTKEELAEVKKELRDINKGMIVMDSVLFHKAHRPKFDEQENQ